MSTIQLLGGQGLPTTYTPTLQSMTSSFGTTSGFPTTGGYANANVYQTVHDTIVGHDFGGTVMQADATREVFANTSSNFGMADFSGMGTSNGDQVADSERVVKYTYDINSRQWKTQEAYVTVDPYPFSSGNLRNAYRMKMTKKPGVCMHCFASLTGRFCQNCGEDSHSATGEMLYVAKSSKTQTDGRDIYEADVMMQALCIELARQYNARNPPRKVKFLEAFLIERVTKPGAPVMACEQFLPGTFKKFSNNAGWMSPEDRNTPQAFSHFTWVASGGKYLVCDIQGAGGGNVPDVYTDPQIHAPSEPWSFGQGNLGQQGVDLFFQTHRCNALCVGLGLSNVLQHQNSGTMMGTMPSHPPYQGQSIKSGSSGTAMSPQFAAAAAAVAPPTLPRTYQPQQQFQPQPRRNSMQGFPITMTNETQQLMTLNKSPAPIPMGEPLTMQRQQFQQQPQQFQTQPQQFQQQPQQFQTQPQQFQTQPQQFQTQPQQFQQQPKQFQQQPQTRPQPYPGQGMPQTQPQPYPRGYGGPEKQSGPSTYPGPMSGPSGRAGRAAETKDERRKRHLKTAGKIGIGIMAGGLLF